MRCEKLVLQMNRFVKAAFACLLGLALFAGPVAAACGDCCPSAPASAAFAAVAACCGDCGPSLERVPDPASIVVQKAIPVPDDVAPLVIPVSTATTSATSFSLSFAAAAVVRDAVPSSPVPLRL